MAEVFCALMELLLGIGRPYVWQRVGILVFLGVEGGDTGTNTSVF